MRNKNHLQGSQEIFEICASHPEANSFKVNHFKSYQVVSSCIQFISFYACILCRNYHCTLISNLNHGATKLDIFSFHMYHCKQCFYLLSSSFMFKFCIQSSLFPPQNLSRYCFWTSSSRSDIPF